MANFGHSEQLFEDATFEHEGHPTLFDNELLAKLALMQTIELN
jgi:hypothetical protein